MTTPPTAARAAAGRVPVAAAAAGVRARARRLLARRPEVWVYALAAAAGAAVIGLAVLAPGHHGEPAPVPGGLESHVPAPSLRERGFPATWASAWAAWLLMVPATMLPLVAPQARRVALRSLWARRHRAIAGFLAGYLALWAVLGAAVVAVLAALGPPPVPAAVAVLVAGAAWQVAPPRRRVLARCGSARPAPVRGWAADRACVVAGWRAGGRCVVTCGPAMLAMALVHSVLLMAALLAVLLHERSRGPDPDRRAGAATGAWGLLACATLVAAIG